jgi:hypothetical protein
VVGLERWAFLTTHPARRDSFFLEKTWGSKQIDEPLWQYDILTTRQPGAKHAPLYFLSALLFGADMMRVHDALQIPVWM